MEAGFKLNRKNPPRPPSIDNKIKHATALSSIKHIRNNVPAARETTELANPSIPSIKLMALIARTNQKTVTPYDSQPS